jgi:hypothetical protein
VDLAIANNRPLSAGGIYLLLQGDGPQFSGMSRTGLARHLANHQREEWKRLKNAAL